MFFMPLEACPSVDGLDSILLLPVAPSCVFVQTNAPDASPALAGTRHGAFPITQHPSLHIAVPMFLVIETLELQNPIPGVFLCCKAARRPLRTVFHGAEQRPPCQDGCPIT